MHLITGARQCESFFVCGIKRRDDFFATKFDEDCVTVRFNWIVWRAVYPARMPNLINKHDYFPLELTRQLNIQNITITDLMRFCW